jgi:hypothetical protein
MTAGERSARETSARESCGNAGAVESLESQEQAFHPSHSSLGISHKTRDSHISTAPTVGVYGRNQSSEIDLLSRICGLIPVPGVVPSCDTGQFPWPCTCESRRIVW